jgi:2-oxoglutarate dehydrogenase complex dehydrogenase (E1) component-like enzyme
VRGHLAANIDPLGLNNMKREDAKKMIIRSVTINDKVCRQSLFVHTISVLVKAVRMWFQNFQTDGWIVCLIVY